uniref:Uncharacterized protein n=1 Tax=Theileria parva TaxID=5875 RepID=Q4N727_THEPA|eukprot:XP_766514.1 hypothetical protein [Theileria parva strain Muguga]
MVKRSIGFSYVLEPYLLGLSCLIGTDQFEILFYDTKASIKFQYVILVTTSVLTLIGCGIINLENNFIFNIFYFSYTILLVVIHLARSRFVFSILFGIVFLVLGYFLLELKTDNFANYFILHVGVLHFLIIVFVKDRIHSPFIITLHTIGISYSMTLIIVYSCSYYSKYKSGLGWFINGLLSALLLPSILWYFLNKSEYHDVNMRSFSESLALLRFLFCFISFLMKHTMGQAKFYIESKEEIYFEGIKENFTKGVKDIREYFPKITDHFKELFRHVEKVFSYSDSQNKEGNLEQICLYIAYFFKVTTFLFMFSAAIILKKSPLIHILYYPYSNYQKILLYNIIRASQLIGSCFGVAYPASETPNHRNFYSITFFVNVSHFILSVRLAYVGQSLSLHTLYALASLSGFALGYTFSYSLVAFSNSALIQTCSDQERVKILPGINENIIPCCGEKFNNQCYCRHDVFDTPIFRFPKPFICSKFIKKCKYLKYDPDGNCAIIIFVKDTDLAQCCTTSCQNGCTRENNSKCLKLIGIYTLDAVTTSACRDCQLTVRLEGKCYGNSRCFLCTSGASGGECTCNGKKFCCLCFKCSTDRTTNCSCCTNCGPGKCCCIKLCSCEGRCASSNGGCNCGNQQTNNNGCKDGKINIKDISQTTYHVGTRVFIAFKNGETQNCCLKEIKPDEVDFDGRLEKEEKFEKLGIFDIQGITLTDCCHADMRIDLHCSIKNNYFRLKGVNYKMKFVKPTSLVLYNRLIVCCKNGETNKCCCLFREHTKLFLLYENCEPKICQTRNQVSSGESCACGICKSLCQLKLNTSSAFVERVDKFRVKLIVISFLLFGLVYLTVLLYTLIIECKNLPKHFDPRATYDQIDELTKKKKFNSVDQVSERLTYLIDLNRLVENANAEKITHLKKMSEALSRYMNEVEHLRVVRNMEDKPSAFLSKSNRQEFVNLDKQLILWSCWVGFFYGYAFPLFIYIQDFFIKWETMWNVEHENYIRFTKPKLNKISHTSKSIGITRTLSWINLKEELRLLTELDDIEKEFDNQPLPESIGERLEYFIDMWTHRRRYLGNWIINKTNVFNWEGFRVDYEEIEDWIEIVSPYLKLGNEFFNISPKEFNKGTEIYGKPLVI